MDVEEKNSLHLELSEPKSARPLVWCAQGQHLIALYCVSIFFVIIGARYWLITKYGSDLPFWDQWEAEGLNLYMRYFEGKLAFSDWFAPHNEHRIFFTRLLSLSLFKMNGQWDARLQMVVNSTIYALVGCGLFLLFAKRFGQPILLIWGIAIAAVFSLPFAWENTLAGFQSVFYLLVGFSLAAIWLMTNSPAWSWKWIAGCLFGVAGLFNLASGFMAAVAVIGVLVLAVLRERIHWRTRLAASWPTGAVCLLIICAGWLLMVKYDRHAVYQASSIAQFISALAGCMAWPALSIPRWWAPFNWLPFIFLLGYYLRSFVREGRCERFTIGVGVWVLLQLVATAYSRAPQAVGSPRYFDIYSLVFLVNLASIFLVLPILSRSAKSKAAAASFILCWATINVYGFVAVTKIVMNLDIPHKGRENKIEELRTAGYLRSGDMGWLITGVNRRTEIPHDNPFTLASMLQLPDIRNILPVSVRLPLALTVREGNPKLLQPVQQTDSQPPYPWERVWWKDDAAGFECAAQKTSDLPFIYFFVSGDYRQLSVVDASNRQHSVVPLAANTSSEWVPAYARCPGPIVKIAAASTGNPALVAFTEPKEMGRLSLYALQAANNAPFFFFGGASIFCAVLLFSVFCWFSKRKTDGVTNEISGI